jgi:Fur family ferric uptake transcriptional regulator
MSKSNATTEIIKENGLKVTQARINVVKVFERSGKRHLSVDEVFQKLTEQGLQVSLGTVYRVLMSFEKAGIVKRNNFENGYAVYELKQESHHDHLVCVKCGRVQEFYDEKIERLQEEIAHRMGFKIMDHAHVIYGLCGDPRCTGEEN